MALVSKKKRGKEGRPLAEEVSSANLFADDLSKLLEYVRSGEGPKADVLRTLVSEAIDAREANQTGRERGTKRLRKVQLEAVTEGTQGLREKLDELLEIGRRLAPLAERIMGRSDENFGIGFETLSLLEGVFSMVRNDLSKPKLIAKAKDGGRAEDALKELEGKYRERATEKVDRVRREVRTAALAAGSKA